jgi:flagellar motility protein MotE (MotC chaperone)
MSRLRLLPVLVFGMVSLLSLKLLSLALNAPPQAAFEERMAAGNVIARSITLAREGVPDDQLITGSTGKKDEKDAKAQPAPPAADEKEKDKARAEMRAKMEPEGVRLPPANGGAAAPAGASAEERALLEKLRDRRTEIDARDRDLELRDNLIRLGERKLDDRIGELRSLESQMGQNGTKNDAKSRFKPLVVMYESMKPKEAARVFDRLDVKVLIELVGHMNPRKVSEILASMDAAAAERLTLALARQAAAGDAQMADTGQAQPDTELARLPAPPTRR